MFPLRPVLQFPPVDVVMQLVVAKSAQGESHIITGLGTCTTETLPYHVVRVVSGWSAAPYTCKGTYILQVSVAF